jgi:hypothetical protein
MLEQSVDQLQFDFLPQKPVVVQWRSGPISGDAGLLPIRQFDESWGYTRRLAACLVDRRCGPEHSHTQMLRQRVYGILAGYEDCNDHDTLRDEPVFKLIAGREVDDDPLASQPTLSRFENGVTCAELQALIDFAIDTGVEHLCDKHPRKRLPEHVTLDLDTTDDPCHGDQQLRLFHGYYDQYQYLPLIISEPTTKHVFLAWLRPGTLHASLGADDDLLRVAGKLREARPDVAIHVRADADFGLPVMMDCCEAVDESTGKPAFSYTFGLRGNAVLKRIAQPLIDKAVRRYECTGQKQRLFMRLEYQAQSWPHPRTVVAKAECHAGGTNLRFVVTSLDVPGVRQARKVYDDYVQRGSSEQRMDELKNGLSADRLSCHRFKAHFLRLLLHTAAYNLLNALRDHPDLPEVLRRGQPCNWRTHLIKVAATVTRSCRRILVTLAGQWPWAYLYTAVSRRALLPRVACGAAGPAP